MARRPRGRRAFTIGSVLGRSFSIWGRNILPFTLLAVIVYSPLLAYTYVTFRERPMRAAPERPRAFGEEPTGPVIVKRGPTPRQVDRYGMVVQYGSRLLDMILAGAVVFGVFQQMRGKKAPFLACVRVGVARLMPVLGVALIVTVAVGLGTLAFVIPGILLNLMFWVAVPVAVVEKEGVVGSIRRSRRLTSGEWGTIFLLLLVLGILHIVVAVGAGIAAASATSKELVVALLTVLCVIPLGALSAVANAVGYHDLRLSKEGVDLEDLVRVFG